MVLLAIVALTASGRPSRPTSAGPDSSAPTPGTTPFAVADASPSQTASAAVETVAATVHAYSIPASGAPSSAAVPTRDHVPCAATDQDRYVYNPGRLEVGQACAHVTGFVQAVRREADGDLHILLALDAPYISLLRAANQGVELGDLVVEPVCVRTVTQVDAMDVCASDPDPLAPPYPAVGQHVWMEGRYVFDLDHGGWAELHPLYRWGPA